MRRRFIHPLADVLLHLGWSYSAIPLCIFAGVVTFGIQGGAWGALLGGAAGFFLGAGFVVAWRLITARRAPRRAPASTISAPRTPPRRHRAESIPLAAPELGDVEVVTGPDALRPNAGNAPMQLDQTGSEASPASQAHAIQKAALNGDLARALALLQDSWEIRDHLFLDPSTALAIGTHAASQCDAPVAAWCLHHADGLSEERLSPLRESLHELADQDRERGRNG